MPGYILAIDDEYFFRRLITMSLESFGYRVVTAEDATSALALIKDEIPELILLDVVLPGISGLELAQQLSEDAQTRSIPLIILSGLSPGQEPSINERINAMNASLLSKPFNPQQLLQVVQTTLETGDKANR